MLSRCNGCRVIVFVDGSYTTARIEILAPFGSVMRKLARWRAAGSSGLLKLRTILVGMAWMPKRRTPISRDSSATGVGVGVTIGSGGTVAVGITASAEA